MCVWLCVLGVYLGNCFNTTVNNNKHQRQHVIFSEVCHLDWGIISVLYMSYYKVHCTDVKSNKGEYCTSNGSWSQFWLYNHMWVYKPLSLEKGSVSTFTVTFILKKANLDVVAAGGICFSQTHLVLYIGVQLITWYYPYMCILNRILCTL